MLIFICYKECRYVARPDMYPHIHTDGMN